MTGGCQGKGGVEQVDILVGGDKKKKSPWFWRVTREGIS